MNREGYTNITSIDYSSVCILRLRQSIPKSRAETLQYIIADITNLSRADFPSASFSVVIDKGTIDAILCGGSFQGIQDALSEVSRVLQPAGVFICVTYGSPCMRIRHFENHDYQWSVQAYMLEKIQVGNINIMFKNHVQASWWGPYTCSAELSALDAADCHFVYVCKKAVA